MSIQNTYVEVNLKNLEHNLNFLRRKISKKTKILCVVKAFGYGSEPIEIAKKLELDYFIHGSDWKNGPQKIARQQLIKLSKKIGMKVIDVPYTKNISSSVIKKKL